MTIKEFKKILNQYDENLLIAFEWDSGLSSPEVVPFIDKEYRALVFDVSNYGSLDD
jgi:hypothetical protein